MRTEDKRAVIVALILIGLSLISTGVLEAITRPPEATIPQHFGHDPNAYRPLEVIAFYEADPNQPVKHTQRMHVGPVWHSPSVVLEDLNGLVLQYQAVRASTAQDPNYNDANDPDPNYPGDWTASFDITWTAPASPGVYYYRVEGKLENQGSDERAVVLLVTVPIVRPTLLASGQSTPPVAVLLDPTLDWSFLGDSGASLDEKSRLWQVRMKENGPWYARHGSGTWRLAYIDGKVVELRR
jgi:hypothetical protein